MFGRMELTEESRTELEGTSDSDLRAAQQIIDHLSDNSKVQCF